MSDSRFISPSSKVPGISQALLQFCFRGRVLHYDNVRLQGSPLLSLVRTSGQVTKLTPATPPWWPPACRPLATVFCRPRAMMGMGTSRYSRA